MGSEADWNIKGEASPELNDRRLDLHRGKYDIEMLPARKTEFQPDFN